MSRGLSGAARLLVSALLGLGCGVVGSFLQPATYDVVGVTLPWGVLAGLVFTGAAVAAAVVTAGAPGGAVAGLGWFLAVGLLSARRPEGDLVITSSNLGYAWLGLGALTVVAVVCVAAASKN